MLTAEELGIGGRGEMEGRVWPDRAFFGQQLLLLWLFLEQCRLEQDPGAPPAAPGTQLCLLQQRGGSARPPCTPDTLLSVGSTPAQLLQLGSAGF